MGESPYIYITILGTVFGLMWGQLKFKKSSVWTSSLLAFILFWVFLDFYSALAILLSFLISYNLVDYFTNLKKNYAFIKQGVKKK